MAAEMQTTFINVYLTVFRWVVPILSALLLFRTIRPLLSFRREPEIWAWLCLGPDRKLPISHWENLIGRSKSCDIVIEFPTVSRNHAVLTRYDDGSWTIADTDSSSGIQVNGKNVKISAVTPKDVMNIGGVEMKLQPITHKQEQKLAQLRTQGSGFLSGLVNVLLLSVLQVLCCTAFVLQGNSHIHEILTGFGSIMLGQWGLLLFYTCIRRTSFEIETIAFFLCTFGMAAISTVVPQEAGKQAAAMAMGIAAFLMVGWSLRDLERAKKVRYAAAAAGVLFLFVTLLFGKEYNGAKNWLIIHGMSLQLSELSKVCFVFVGASTMDRLMKKRNLVLFIVYSVIICGCLALMNDFGTALIFFCAFLVTAFLRSGSWGTIALACTALGFAGVVALKIAPHALRRFSSWGHIWEDPLNTGFQQTRALMCMASGGMLGLSPGRGWMRHVFAADSDMVFATITEEYGFLVAAMAVLSVIGLGIFVVRSAAVARSSFYTIGGCTAVSVLLVQVILNALGTVDLIPLTGVTFPFLSNGGSSMIGSWGLLAFVKAADTRQNASFAVRLSSRGGNEYE